MNLANVEKAMLAFALRERRPEEFLWRNINHTFS